MPIGSNNSIIPGCGSHHIAIKVRDMEESLKLYRDLLGMKKVVQAGAPDSRIILLDMGDGSHIELVEPPPGTPSPTSPVSSEPIIHFALATTDTVAAIEHVREAGYVVTMEPKTLKFGPITITIAFFDGPSGESIEFFQTHAE